MYDVTLGYLTYACGIALLMVAFYLVYYLAYYMREYITTKICWFCNERIKVPFASRNEWFCTSCKQFNGFNKDGSYTKTIPEQFDESLNRVSFTTATKKHHVPTGNGLCRVCNGNQELKIKQLAAYVPFRESSYDTEIEAFKQKLEDAYKLCSKCEKVLQITLMNKANLVTRNADVAHNEAIVEKHRKYKTTYLVICAILVLLCVLHSVSYVADTSIIDHLYVITDFSNVTSVLSSYFQSSFESERNYYSVHTLLESLFLCKILFLYRTYPQLFNRLFVLLASLISSLFMIDDHMEILNISNDLKISIAFAGVLILPLYSILSAKILSRKTENLYRVNQHFLKNFSPFFESENTNKNTAENDKCDDGNREKINLPLNSVSNSLFNLKLNSPTLSKDDRTTTPTNSRITENPFFKLHRRRNNIVKPPRFVWNNLKTTGDENSSAETSSSSSVGNDEDNNSSSVKVKTIPINRRKNIGKFDEVPNMSNFFNDHLSPSPVYHPFYNNYNNNNNNHNNNGYSTVLGRSSSTPLYFQYSNSVFRTPAYGLFSAYSVVPETAVPPPPYSCHYPSCCSYASHRNDNYCSSSQSSYVFPSSINVRTIFSMLFCCVCCFVLGTYINSGAILQ